MDEETLSLASSIADSQHTIDLILSNQYDAAKQFIRPLSERSMYHAHSYATIIFVEVVMGYDQSLTGEAIGVISRACSMVRRLRRSFTVTSASSLSEVAVHAELCYAELLLQRSLLTFLLDEGILTFVRAAFRMREAFAKFRECWKLLQHRVWPLANESLRVHFECGVKLSIAVFNLLLSMLPRRVLLLLKFIGFSGDKDLGERLLREAAGPECATSVRSSFASMAALMYFLDLQYSAVAGNRKDIDFCRSIVKRFLDRYPQSAFFKYFVGRLSVIEGRIEQAMFELEASVAVQNVWRHLHLFGYWELLWCHAYECDWLLAMKTAECLERDFVSSRKREHELERSRSVLMYMEAAFMYTLAFAPQPRLRQSAPKLTPSTAAQKQQSASQQIPETNAHRMVVGLRDSVGGSHTGEALEATSDAAVADCNRYMHTTNISSERGSLATASASSESCSTSPSNAPLLFEEKELSAYRLRIEQLLNDLPAHTQKVAGRSLPSEKFVVSRAARYRERGGTLTLPAIELMYLWPTFRPLFKRQALAENLLHHVEATLQQLEPFARQLERQHQPVTDISYFWDEYALAMLLKGALLRTLRQTSQARICLSEVTTHLASRVQHDRHVLVSAHLELAHVLMDSASASAPAPAATGAGGSSSSASGAASASGELDVVAVEAELTKARERYSHYLFESRLQFRVRGAQYRMLAIREHKCDAPLDYEERDVEVKQNGGVTLEVFSKLPPVQSVCASSTSESSTCELKALISKQMDRMQFADEDAFVDAPEAPPSTRSAYSS